MGTWWFHLHRALQLLGFLISVAGLAVGVYLDPGVGGLFWQHKIIGITVNVLSLVQVRITEICCSQFIYANERLLLHRSTLPSCRDADQLFVVNCVVVDLLM